MINLPTTHVLLDLVRNHTVKVSIYLSYDRGGTFLTNVGPSDSMTVNKCTCTKGSTRNVFLMVRYKREWPNAAEMKDPMFRAAA